MRRFDHSWTILTVGFVVLFFAGGSRFAFGLMLKPMTEDLGWSRSQLSLAVTTFLVVSALALPLVGRMVDRFSLKWILAGGALLGGVGIGLIGRVSAPWQVFVLYGFVYAIGTAGTHIAPVGVMISRWFVRRRGIANSAAISGQAIGQLVIITVLASTLTSLGWRASFALLGAVYAVVVVPLVLATVRSSPQTQPGDQEKHDSADRRTPAHPELSFDVVLRSRQLWLLVVVYGICGFQDFFMATHVVAFARDQGMGSVLAGNMLALMGLMGLIGVLSSGVLADAFGAGRPTALCFLMRTGIFALVLAFQDTAGVVAFALLYGFTFLITAPLTVVFVGNIFGSARLGTVSGLINMVHQISGGLGAFVGAFIFDRSGSYDGAFALMLGLAILAIPATLMIRERPLAPLAAQAS